MAIIHCPRGVLIQRARDITSSTTTATDMTIAMLSLSALSK